MSGHYKEADFISACAARATGSLGWSRTLPGEKEAEIR